MSTDTATDSDDTLADTSTDIREADDHVDHWTDLQFVYLAIALAIITAIEVACLATM